MSRGAEPSMLVVQTVYGEKYPEAEKFYMCCEVWQVKDQSGVHTSERFDLRGHCLGRTFQPAREYKKELGWRDNNATVGAFTHGYVRVDNFGQVLGGKDAQGNRTRRTFSRTVYIESVNFLHKSGDSEAWDKYLVAAEYSADGLPLIQTYGNGVSTQFEYDDATRNLVAQQTFSVKTRGGSKSIIIFEDISITYDCEGRRVQVVDAAEQSRHFQNCKVDAKWEYTYDSIGQLVAATGRAQLPDSVGRGISIVAPGPGTGLEPARGVTNGDRLYQYLETYDYDNARNLKMMMHSAPSNRNISGWTRHYKYKSQSLLSSGPLVSVTA